MASKTYSVEQEVANEEVTARGHGGNTVGPPLIKHLDWIAGCIPHGSLVEHPPVDRHDNHLHEHTDRHQKVLQGHLVRL